MNTIKQIFELNNKLQSSMDRNKGVVTLTFFDKKQVTVRVLGANTNYDFQNSSYESKLRTFTTDINMVTEYDLADVQDIS